MNRKGFISMAVVYTFIVVFILLMLSLISLYAYRNKVVNNEVDDVKEILNKEYE